MSGQLAAMLNMALSHKLYVTYVFLGMLSIYNDFRIRSFSLTEYIAIIKVWKNIGLYVCLCVPVGVSLYVCLSLISNSQRLTARFQ